MVRWFAINISRIEHHFLQRDNFFHSSIGISLLCNKVSACKCYKHKVIHFGFCFVTKDRLKYWSIFFLSWKQCQLSAFRKLIIVDSFDKIITFLQCNHWFWLLKTCIIYGIEDVHNHPLRTTRAHVPNLCMGNLVQGIFGAKFVNFWDALAGNEGISLILCYIMVCNGHVSDLWCVKVFYVYKFELIWGGKFKRLKFQHDGSHIESWLCWSLCWTNWLISC